MKLRVKVGDGLAARATYDPDSSWKLFEELTEQPQDITLKYCRPFFLFSKSGMAWQIEREVKVRGHLRSFEPVEVAGEPPQMSVGIELVETGARRSGGERATRCSPSRH